MLKILQNSKGTGSANSILYMTYGFVMERIYHRYSINIFLIFFSLIEYLVSRLLLNSYEKKKWNKKNILALKNIEMNSCNKDKTVELI